MRICIIGAGPAGLGAAWRLRERGHEDWDLYEQQHAVGGLSGSYRDKHGFSWDYAGHAFFGGQPDFRRFLSEMLGNAVIQHDRETFIMLDGHQIPQPFEMHLERLPEEQMVECFAGLGRVFDEPRDATNFLTFLQSTFGPGVCRHFMVPYNEKVWATPLDEMSADWIAERVCVTDFRDSLLRAIKRGWTCNGTIGGAWGPNKQFCYPAAGGAGEPYRRLAEQLGERVHTATGVVRIDTEQRKVFFRDEVSGALVPRQYDALVSSLPLPALVRMLRPHRSDLCEAAAALKHNSLCVVGLGVENSNPIPWHWAFYPEPETLFHRIVNHSSYSPDNVPHGDTARYHSLFCEVSYGATKARPEHIVERCIEDCIRLGAIRASDRERIVSKQLIEIPLAYPVPTLGRDKALDFILGELEAMDIHSVGRLGRWRYEEGNMDHAFGHGCAAIDTIYTNDAGQ